MTLEFIRDLIPYIPRPINAFLPRNPGGTNCGCSETELWAYALNQPRFGYLFVKSVRESNSELPVVVYNFNMIWLNEHLEGSWSPGYIAEALALAHPQQNSRSALLEALLLCPKVPFHQIAKALNCEVEVILAYSDLLFNVRDRMNDPLYINRIVYPRGKPLHHSLQRRTLRSIYFPLAYEHGLDAVLVAAGLKKANEASTQAMIQDIEDSILREALNCVQLKQLDDPAVRAAIKISQGDRYSTPRSNGVSDWEVGLGAVSMSQPIIDTVKKLRAQDLADRDARRAAAANQKHTAPPESEE
jgi:hypothetical protein